MTIAFIRTYNNKQNSEVQEAVIREFAESQKIEIGKWAKEVGNSPRANRRLESIVKSLSPGDEILVSDISRVSRKMIEIIHIILDTLNEMLPDEDPRKAHINEELITYVEDRKGHDRRYAIAPDKIKEEVGWYPETCFEDGIRLTIQWFFEHEDWMKNVTSGDYQKYYEAMYKTK